METIKAKRHKDNSGIIAACRWSTSIGSFGIDFINKQPFSEPSLLDLPNLVVR